MIKRTPVALLAAALIGLFGVSGTAAAAPDAPDVTTNSVSTEWDQCLFSPDQGDLYWEANVFEHDIALFCGQHNSIDNSGFGVRHVAAGHSYNYNTDACISKILSKGRYNPGAATGEGNLAYTYESGGQQGIVIYTATPSLAPSSHQYSVVTAYLIGWANTTEQWDRCATL